MNLDERLQKDLSPDIYCLVHNEIVNLGRKIKIKDAYLKLIYCVAFDYDNCNTIKDLQDLLDEIMKYSDLAIDSDDTTPIYNITDEISENILGEKIIKGE